MSRRRAQEREYLDEPPTPNQRRRLDSPEDRLWQLYKDGEVDRHGNRLLTEQELELERQCDAAGPRRAVDVKAARARQVRELVNQHEQHGLCLFGPVEGYADDVVDEALHLVALVGRFPMFNADHTDDRPVVIERVGRSATYQVVCEGTGVVLGRVQWEPRNRAWTGTQSGKPGQRFRLYYRAVRHVVWSEVKGVVP